MLAEVAWRIPPCPFASPFWAEYTLPFLPPLTVPLGTAAGLGRRTRVRSAESSELIGWALDVVIRPGGEAAATRLAKAVIERLSSIERMRMLRPSEALPGYYERREDVCLALLLVAYQRCGELSVPDGYARRDEFLSIIGEEGVFAQALYALGLAAPSVSGVVLAA